MAQFARPSADTFLGAWVDESAAAVNIFNSIDESSANDADFITSEAAPANSPYVTKLTSLLDPVSSANHIVRYRYAKSSSSGAQIDLTVQLRQGYVNEGTPGTLIAATSHTNITNALTNGTFTLTGPQADSITDYTDLYIRFVANQV